MSICILRVSYCCWLLTISCLGKLTADELADDLANRIQLSIKQLRLLAAQSPQHIAPPILPRLTIAISTGRQAGANPHSSKFRPYRSDDMLDTIIAGI